MLPKAERAQNIGYSTGGKTKANMMDCPDGRRPEENDLNWRMHSRIAEPFSGWRRAEGDGIGLTERKIGPVG
jgi:hypothetical protein